MKTEHSKHFWDSMPQNRAKSGHYPFRFDPELGRFRLFEPNEELPVINNDKLCAKYKNVQFGKVKDMDRLNRGLGVKERYVKEKLVEMSYSGSNLQEMGNDMPEIAKQKETIIDRNMVDHIKNTVK